jgi:phospholipase/carboxylesterase
MIQVTSLHAGQPVLTAGTPLGQARAAMVLLHGRGASAQSMLKLANELALPGVAYLAPQAAGGTWYPNRFLAPIASNEPWLSSAMDSVRGTFRRIEASGLSLDRTVLLGFSQGACLALEFAARHARHYGGIAGLSGGLIGPDGTPRNYTGTLAGTPILLGCSDVDFHIPKERVIHTAQVMEQLGAQVTLRLYPNMDHTINTDEMDFVRSLMVAAITRSPSS